MTHISQLRTMLHGIAAFKLRLLAPPTNQSLRKISIWESQQTAAWTHVISCQHLGHPNAVPWMNSQVTELEVHRQQTLSSRKVALRTVWRPLHVQNPANRQMKVACMVPIMVGVMPTCRCARMLWLQCLADLDPWAVIAAGGRNRSRIGVLSACGGAAAQSFVYGDDAKSRVLYSPHRVTSGIWSASGSLDTRSGWLQPARSAPTRDHGGVYLSSRWRPRQMPRGWRKFRTNCSAF